MVGSAHPTRRSHVGTAHPSWRASCRVGSRPPIRGFVTVKKCAPLTTHPFFGRIHRAAAKQWNSDVSMEAAGAAVPAGSPRRPVLCGNKDAGAWTIPKGEPADGEALLEAARARVSRRDRLAAIRTAIPLKAIKQKGGKTVHAWAVEGDLDPAAIVSNTFEMEWPPRSGKRPELPRNRPRRILRHGRGTRKDPPRPAPIPGRADGSPAARLSALAQQSPGVTTRYLRRSSACSAGDLEPLFSSVLDFEVVVSVGSPDSGACFDGILLRADIYDFA